MVSEAQHETLRSLTKLWAIGLTGGIATGKSTIARTLRAAGEIVLDADQLAREVVAVGSEGLAAVVKHFGSQVLQADGQLDRTLLRQIIFKDPTQRHALEAITHPRILSATLFSLEKLGIRAQPRLWFYEASLLFERSRAADFREIWVAYCPEPLQIERLMRRDHCTAEEARRILDAQMPAHKKAEQADRVIDTDCSEDELARRVAEARAALQRTLP